MDELEFRKRVYANPRDLDGEVLEAARANPDYQKIVDETLAFEDSLIPLIESAETPEGLMAQLLSIPETAASVGSNVSAIRAKKQSFFQYYAVAASLVLAVGIVFSLSVNSGPSSADIVFGNELLAHLYHDIEEIDDITNGETYETLDLDEVNFSMAVAGTRLVSYDDAQEFDVRSAKPCEILPAYQSAHLVLEGSHGAVSVIVINNSPVDVKFSFRDDRFNGIVVPMEQGNMILVGEKNEDLNQYASMFSENVEWVI
ncbi:MAG: hypothetical protein COB20_02165 [SAR86 cluster bacterium]|uniref:DUF3379 domain-containing protein n=1 Tax=SAR86 cluster bacterium TaxID=2030880 RepID=A0A2A4XGC1_9GAMM|nr:MAG: hypothetical protein COB20_02165 [SAR86 cluster bacterium]